MKRLSFALAALGAASVSLAQNTGFSIADGTASYAIASGGALAVSPTAAFFPAASVRLNGAASPNNLFEDWWSYRLLGDNREFNIANATSRVVGANTATYGYDLVTPGAVWGTAQLTYTLTQPSAGTARVDQRFRVNNTGTAPRSFALFHYLDLDLNGTFTGDTATLTTPNQRMSITDGPIVADYWGLNATAYRAGAFATVRTSLTDAVADNWANTGLPFGPGDFTGSYQWVLTVPAGGSIEVFVSYGLNTSAVPAPGAAALLAMGGVLAARRRR